MSDSSPVRKLPEAVLQGTAELHVVNQSEHSSGVVQRESLSSDIQAFCALAARILLRCLRERDEKALRILGFSKECSPDTTDLV